MVKSPNVSNIVFEEDVMKWLRSQYHKKGDLSRIVNDCIRKQIQKPATPQPEPNSELEDIPQPNKTEAHY